MSELQRLCEVGDQDTMSGLSFLGGYGIPHLNLEMGMQALILATYVFWWLHQDSYWPSIK